MTEILLEDGEKDRELKEKKKELRCKGHTARKIISDKVPIVTWLPNYNIREYLKGDVVAGVTVGVMLIPQSMAYAMVAGLPPIYGLYSSIVPLIVFGMFTTSRHLSVGPFAIISLLVGEAVSQFLRDQTNDVQKYIHITLLLTFLCGVIKILFGIFRFGFLVNFLSDPVRSGFNSASAIIIGVSQLKHLFGVSVPTETFMWRTIFDLAKVNKALPKTNGWAVLIGVTGIVMLLALKKLSQKLKVSIPGALVVVGLGTILSWSVNLQKNAHIIVVGDVPSGFPHLVNPFTMVPEFWSTVTQLLPSALIIVVVTFISAISISSKFADEFKYKVDANQELLAMGLADTIGSVFSAYPLAASLSRTAVNVQSGAKTPLSGMISTLLIIVALLFLAPVVYYIPRALLASIVLVAVVDIIDYKRVRELWKTHRRDMTLLLLAFFATLAVGILQGLLIGIGASLFVILYRNAYPPVAELGRLLGSTTYINRKRFPHAVTVPGLIVVRFDSSLYFANVEYVRKRLRRYTRKADPSVPPVKWIIMDCSSMIDIDSTAIRSLKEASTELRENDIQLFFACVKGPLRDAIRKCGVVGFVGQDHFFWSVHDAVGQYYVSVLHTLPPSVEAEQKTLHQQAHATASSSNATNTNKTTDDNTSNTTTNDTTNIPTANIDIPVNSPNMNKPNITIITDNALARSSSDINKQFHANKSREDEEYSPFVFDARECKEVSSSPLLPNIELPKIHLRLPHLPQRSHSRSPEPKSPQPKSPQPKSPQPKSPQPTHNDVTNSPKPQPPTNKLPPPPQSKNSPGAKNSPSTNNSPRPPHNQPIPPVVL